MAEHSDNQMIQTAATPAGIDFLIRSIGGLVGQDAAQGASAAVEYEKTGYVPAKDELPLVKSILIHYPTTSVRSVERFYDELGQVQEVTKNMNYLLSRNDPTALWYSQENQETLALARSYTYAGQTIANMRRSILDVKTAPKGSFTSEQRRQMIDFYTQSIIEMTSQLEQMKAQFDLGVQQSPAVMQK